MVVLQSVEGGGSVTWCSLHSNKVLQDSLQFEFTLNSGLAKVTQIVWIISHAVTVAISVRQ